MYPIVTKDEYTKSLLKAKRKLEMNRWKHPEYWRYWEKEDENR